MTEDDMDAEFEANIGTFRAQAIDLDQRIGSAFLEWFTAQPMGTGSERANTMTAIQIAQAQIMAAAIWAAYDDDEKMPADIAEAAGAAFTDLLAEALGLLVEKEAQRTRMN